MSKGSKNRIRRRIRRIKRWIFIAIISLTVFSVLFVCCLVGSVISCFLPVETETFENLTETPLSAQVELLRPLVQQYAQIHEMQDYEAIIMGIIQQESGGNGIDVMQCAECGLAEITSQEISIDTGIQYLKILFNNAGVTSAKDLNNIYIALQAYNFGGGFIDYVLANGGIYNMGLVLSFQQQQMAILGWGNYGDANYVQNVWRYCSGGTETGADCDQNSPYYGAGCNIFTDAGYAGQCTWYVWGRANEMNDGKYIGYILPSGNAAEWLEIAGTRQFEISMIPRANSIMVFGDVGAGYGHVAYVESIDIQSNSITFSDGNTGNPAAEGIFFENHNYTNNLEVCFRYVKIHTMQIDQVYNYLGSDYFIKGFIYL